VHLSYIILLSYFPQFILYWTVLTMQNYSFFTLLDASATFLLAYTAAFRASRLHYHFTGSVLLGTMVGLVSPLFRDLFLGFDDIVVLTNDIYLTSAVTGAILARFSALKLPKAWLIFMCAESASIGLAATIAGAKASTYGLTAVGCIIIGLIAATIGAGIRDLSLGETPLALELDNYVSAAAMGIMLFLGLKLFFFPFIMAITLSTILAISMFILGNHKKMRMLDE